MELADRHHIEEFRLRYVVTVASEYHAEIVRQIIDFNLTAKQIKELCEGDGCKPMKLTHSISCHAWLSKWRSSRNQLAA